MTKPIKRVEEMQDVSRDHHHALLLTWKINKGIDKGIEPDRIRVYVLWFREEHMIPHFDVEEQWVFPVLEPEHPHIQQVLDEHKVLLDLSLKAKDYSELKRFGELLKEHVRIEERIVFNEIQDKATPTELKNIQLHHHHKDFCERTVDEFWK